MSGHGNTKGMSNKDMSPSSRAPLSERRGTSLKECLNTTSTQKARSDRASSMEATNTKVNKEDSLRCKLLLYLYKVLFTKFMNVFGMFKVLKNTAQHGEKVDTNNLENK